MKIFIYYTLFLFLAVSCQNNNNTQHTYTKLQNELKKEEVEKKVKHFIYPMPTPFEATKMLKKNGASYILSLSNPVNNSEKYFTAKSKALNAGIYSTDLSYATTYNQKQIVYNYISALNYLLQELDLNFQVNQHLIDSLKTFENNKGKMIELITNTFYTAYEQLEKTGRGSISALILAGSYIEALYITTHILKNSNDYNALSEIMNHQQESLLLLTEHLEQYCNDVYINEIQVMLNPLNQLFDAMETDSFNKKQFEQIAHEVHLIRKEMIETP